IAGLITTRRPENQRGPASKRPPRNQLNIEIKMLAKNAVQNPDREKPDTSADTSIIIRALMTSRKSPSVNRVSGSVNNTNSGRMMALTKPSSSAEIISDEALENLMPLNTWLLAHSASERMTQCSRKGVTIVCIINPLCG